MNPRLISKGASTTEKYLDSYPQLSRLNLSQDIFDGHKSYSFLRLNAIQALLSVMCSALIYVYNPRTKIMSYNFLRKYQTVL